MKMELAALTCLLFLSRFALLKAENQDSGHHEFTEDWLPGSEWIDSLEAFDGYQIPGTPPTLSTPSLKAKDYAVTSGTILPAYESKNMDISTPAMDLENGVQSSDQSTMKNNGAEVKVVKRENDDKENSWKSKYDPALIMMGLGKRLSAYDPAYNIIGFNNREFLYNPSLEHMRTGKRNYNSDPPVQYTGKGRRHRRGISAVRSVRSKRSIPYSNLDTGTNEHSRSIFAGTTQVAFKPRQVESYAPELIRNMESSLLNKGNALKYEDLVSEEDEFKPNQIDMIKKKKNTLIHDSSNISGTLETPPIDEDNALKYKRLVSAQDEIEYNRLDLLKNKDKTLIPEASNTVVGIPTDKSKDQSKDKSMVYEILGVRNSPAILDVLRRNFGINSPSIKQGANGIRLEMSPKRFKELTDNNALSINVDVGKRNTRRQSSKKFSYDPALKYMGLGKRQKNRGGQISNYDPALQYMGLGKRNEGDAIFKRESYDPAFKYMGLGKRNNTHVHSKRVLYDPAFQYMGLGKREIAEFNSKRESYDPAFQYMGLGKREDAELNSKRQSYDPAFQYMGLGKREGEEFNSKRTSYDPAFQYMGLGKREDEELNSKRQSYDPAFQYMGLGKRNDAEVTSKRESYDPAFQYMGLGKRNDAEVNSKRESYDPAFQYMGLGKREDAELNSKRQSYDPAFQYMGLGKRNDAEVTSKRESYDPAFQYMGLGKREDSVLNSKRQSYDPAFQYMGLGKRNNAEENSKMQSYDPEFQYMGLGKRNDSEVHSKRQYYDPAYQYMGLGKRKNYNVSFERQSSDSGFKNMDIGKELNSRGIRSANFDPGLKYLGLGKRVNDGITLSSFDHLNKRESSHGKNYVQSLKETSFGKSKKYRATPISNYDPAFHYMGLGKKDNAVTSWDKREKGRQQSSSFDPALKYMGLGKRNEILRKAFYDPAFKYMGLGKRLNNRDSRGTHFDPALKYLGLGKRVVKNFVLTNDPALNYKEFGTRESLGRQNIISGHKSELKRGSDLRSSKKIASYNPALNYMGLGKREDVFDIREQMRRSNKFDPTLQYMGLGKRQQHPKPLVLKKDFSPDIQLSKSIFDDSKRVKRQIETEEEEEDEAYPKLHRIDNIDTPQGILPYKTDDLEQPVLNLTGIDSEFEDEVEFIPEYMRGPYAKDCFYTKPCNRDPRNDEIMLPLIQASENSMTEKDSPKGMQMLPEIQTNETNSSNRDLHRIQDLPEIKTSEASSTDRVPPRIHSLPENKTFENSPIYKFFYSMNGSPDIKTLHIIHDLPEKKTYETNSSDRDSQGVQDLPEIKKSKTRSTDTASYRVQDLPEIKTTESSPTDTDLRKMEKLQEINTSETSNNHRALRRIRDLNGIETSVTSLLETAPWDLRGINAPGTSSIQTNPNIDHRQNKLKVEGTGRAVERSGYPILNVKRNMVDIDHRPRYNPGWVFIGLGKRSTILLDPKVSFLTKCYYLLTKINDALMRLQYRTKKFPLKLQPDPFGFTHKSVRKNSKSLVRDFRVPSYRRVKEGDN